MNRKEKYAYWAMLSNYDLDTARVLIDGERWVYVAYLCQQAVERQLKGMYVYHTDKEAPKSHNLSYLFKKITEENTGLDHGADEALFAEKQEWLEDFLVDLMFYYMSDYPFSYKKIQQRFIDRALANELFRKTLDAIEWLRTLQETPDTVQMTG